MLGGTDQADPKEQPWRLRTRLPTRSRAAAQPGSPGQQEWWQVEVPVNLNTMHGDVPPKISERMGCHRLLERLVFSLDVAQAISCNHSYDTAKKLLSLDHMTLTF